MRQLLARASEARQQGRSSDAKALLGEAVAAEPQCGAALNMLGLIALSEANASSAVAWFGKAVEADPTAAALYLNLAEAWRAAGNFRSELEALDGALKLNPYLLPALFRKAAALERAGRIGESLDAWKAAVAVVSDEGALPDAMRQLFEHARRKIADAGEARFAEMQKPLSKIEAQFPHEDLSRALVYAQQSAGVRKIYQPQPTGGHFPFLSAYEFFPRALFPWLEELEAATDVIHAELLSLWDEEAGFRPYVAYDPTLPVNQWSELNHSTRWSAWFFAENGVPDDANRARCPATASVLDRLPLMDHPGKAPSPMFSVLKPRTRIPPHTGSSNVRTTVHLPLVVPPGCGFRVGGETREWKVGEAWAFDDTIEHEAWNDSDQPRAILIVDAWNPLLTEAERAVVRAIG